MGHRRSEEPFMPGAGAEPSEDAVWASVPRPTPDRPTPDEPSSDRPTPDRARLTWAWRDGLAGNPAAPATVLRRLLDPPPEGAAPSSAPEVPFALVYRELPDEVVDAWIAHPDWRIRKRLADRWRLTPEQSARLLADPEPHRRWYFLVAAIGHNLLSEETLARLAADPSPRIRAELARHHALPAATAVTLAADPDPGIRAAALPHAWEHLDEATRASLRDDPDPAVRTRAALLHHRTVPLTPSAYAELPPDAREEAAEHCRLGRDLAERLTRDPDDRLRARVASNASLDTDLVAVLASDPATRWQVSVRPDLTEEERSRIPVQVGPDDRLYPLDWVLALQDDPEAVRRCATSSHPLLRRSAACAASLPQDVADLLARDEDRVVRLLLSEHCAQAPAEVLLETLRTWEGYSAACIPDHPNFPRNDLIRYADDAVPALRALALDDPRATAGLAERLSRDDAPHIRRRALRDPRLSPASVVRLLDDPDLHVRVAAAADPRLPAPVLAELLHDPATANAAAANPALPEPVMHRLLDGPPTAPENPSA
ncbi:PE-PGRS family protein [Streptomyces huiliensis]|uniref:PE-PGRS family protein n=1 Tax=Streptomyces huiliensis TaxID=2876027 RepID=UPI001CBF8494|nr:PE-PGRS family protein [Streptomyces huiliensis]MBZ4323696.1 PE-PGRS family protein [Streptomyces huiliensis]